jgi:ABC-2 type transport system ATP-binding protein
MNKAGKTRLAPTNELERGITMIEINTLTKTYKGDVKALQGVSMNIGAGMFGLLGPNGAGKTTLMRIIAGLLRPTSGTVRVFGYDITTAAGKQATKELLGYLPQELGLYPNLSAREFLNYIGVLKGITNAAARSAQVDELLELVRLTDIQHRKLKTFSGGQKRRVGIAQALLGNPRLIIVDEPTVGLDPEERVRFRNLLSDMAQRCTVILSTHIIEDINASCNDLAIIHHGGVLYRGSPAELIQQARGKVWNVVAQGDYPEGVSVVTALQLQDTVQYRVLGMPASHYQATPLEPSLEDAYILTMERNKAG